MIRRFLTLALGSTALAMPCVVVAQNADAIFDAPDRPSLNFYGAPGLIDMPSGEALPDGQFTVGVSHFGGQTRTTLSFQATPRISASFRYIGVQDLDIAGFDDVYRDRSFDLRFLINRESRYLPAVTVGLQDFAGTGIYGGEFVAATKTFEGARLPGRIKATVGLGWGRLGSSGGIGAPFGSDRPAFVPGDTGGELSTDQWFRGEAAPFAGVEWQINDKFGVKAEYSSDAYALETSEGVFERDSRFNFGAEYQVSDAIRLGAYYLYGSEFGVNVQMQLNPSRPPSALRIPAPRPFDVRPRRSADPQAYSGDWVVTEAAASGAVRDALIPLLEAEGLTLVEASTTASTTEIRFRNERYRATTIGIGRVARAMARVLPASVETFRITPMIAGLPQSTVVFRRSDLEALETSPNAPDALLAVSGIENARPSLVNTARNQDLYPAFRWSVGPYIAQSFFDPEEPVRIDAGISAKASFNPAPGWTIAGELRHRLTGNIGENATPSTSNLEPVRTNAGLYAQGADTTLRTLYVNHQWKPRSDLYARVTAGYLERMFGGVSAEMLWKPVASRLALGVEANYVRQREFDQGFGFQDYGVATGHISAYYEFGNGYTGQLDVGRYLAGDVGATVTLERAFDNGWKVGGFFTLTDVSADDFGEGSFDKGITLTIPVDWFLGQPDSRSLSTTIRPIQRDGGARLSVPNRLYDQVVQGHREGLVGNWSGVWQ
ncbi:YjbH domain-containing protein [Sulfitobacter albidus]|uniref:YjbH domain-containing protein n=1 Tax=Sulfitobacter albidus TaxID=2829501 RepID=A0A975JCZ1_9RHOB|nr:YjbH domain-containing protein [Sulfitobacter albidus]QUJ76077.1 YjbH domain-containing protein [Sulfitobacter albidus]